MNYHNNKKQEDGPLEEPGIARTSLPYHVSASYFDNLHSEILSAVAAACSQNDADVVSFSRNNVFSLPQGYFETLPAILLNKAKAADQVILAGNHSWADSARTLPYQIPAGYFEHLEQELSERLFHSETEIEELPSLLNDLRSMRPMTVPEDYFKGNDHSSIIDIKPEVKTKTQEHPSVRSIRWTSWAAAAAVLFIIGMGGWHFLNPSGNIPKATFEQKLAQIPKSDIQNYINNNLEEFDINMIENSISQATKNDMAASALSGVSDADIEAYLNEGI